MPTLTERNRVFDDAFRRARGRPPNFVQHSVNAIRVSIAKILSSIADPKASSSYPHFAFPRRRQWPEKRRGPMAFAPPDKFDKWNPVAVLAKLADLSHAWTVEQEATERSSREVDGLGTEPRISPFPRTARQN